MIVHLIGNKNFNRSGHLLEDGGSTIKTNGGIWYACVHILKFESNN